MKLFVALGWWRCVIAAVVVFFWLMPPSWAKSAREFGPELFVVFPVVNIALFSPLVGLIDLAVSTAKWRAGSVDLFTLQARLGWCLALVTHLAAFVLRVRLS